MKIKVLFSIAAVMGAFVSHSSAIQGQIVPGFDQRYLCADYDAATGTLADASGNGQTATAQTDTTGQDSTPGGTFSCTTTPSGVVALQNSDAAGDTGERLEFTRANQLGGTGNGFTIQAVYSGTASGADGASGIFGLSEDVGYSGVFLGGQPGSVEVRGGNVDDQGNTQGAFLNDGAVANAALDGQFAIYTLVVNPNAPAGNVLTATIVDPISGNVLASTALGDPGSAIAGIGNIGGLFAGEVGGNPGIGNTFGNQDNFQGAIAEVVVYNSVMSPAQLAQNDAYFYETYFAPATFPLGDVNRDTIVNFLDIAPFIVLLSNGEYQVEADINL